MNGALGLPPGHGNWLGMRKSAAEGLADTGTQELLAMIEVMFLVAQADGVFSPNERRSFLAHVQSLSEGKIGVPELTSLVERWGSAESLDVSERLTELAVLLPDETSRRIAYGLAMGIAEADGQVLESESVLLFQIAKTFGLDDEESEEIAHSVRMSSRAPSAS